MPAAVKDIATVMNYLRIKNRCYDHVEKHHFPLKRKKPVTAGTRYRRNRMVYHKV